MAAVASFKKVYSVASGEETSGGSSGCVPSSPLSLAAARRGRVRTASAARMGTRLVREEGRVKSRRSVIADCSQALA